MKKILILPISYFMISYHLPASAENQPMQGNVVNVNIDKSNNELSCNNNQNQSVSNNETIGTSYQKNPSGGYNTVYSTGNKQPYYVDNGCNQQSSPIIEPYVEYNQHPRHRLTR